MTFGDLVSQYWKDGLWAIFIVSGLIQLSPIKLNPWGWIAKKIGKAMNGELIEKIDKLEKTLDAHVKSNEENYAIEKRLRILQFADYIQNGANSSQSHFEQILADITEYNNYCETHPNFKNRVTVHAAKLIEEIYDTKLRDGTFL